MVETCVVIVAAGSGSRYGADRPKQFLDLRGRPVLRHCIDTFRLALPSAPIVLVLSEVGRCIWSEYCERANYASPHIVAGGPSRSDSVLNGLNALLEMGVSGDAVVLVHDGARPLLSQDTVRSLVDAFSDPQTGAAAPAVPLTDSVALVDGDKAVARVDRSTLRAIQTPQAFRLAEIAEAHSRYDVSKFGPSTDECGAYMAVFGRPVTLIPGSPANIKITNPGDIARAELLLC